MTETVPGNPHGIRELAVQLSSRASAAESVATTLSSAKSNIEGGDLRLKGGYAAKVQDAIHDLPSQLRKLGSGYSGCGQALSKYADSLEEAQRQAGNASGDHESAEQARRSAERELDRLQPGWESVARTFDFAGGGLIGDQFGDQSDQVRAAIERRDRATKQAHRASKLVEQAENLRRKAEHTAAEEIRDALDDSGMKNKSFWQKVGNYLKESFTTWDGFVKLCENVSTVLAVAAIFLGGPLALVVGAVLLATAVVAMADKIKQFRDGKIGWKELALAGGMVLLDRVGGRVLRTGIKGLQKTRKIKALSDHLHGKVDKLWEENRLGVRGRNLAHRAVCTVTGHPVDIATGKLFTDFTDLELPGPLPLRLERVWYSTSTYRGPLGHGWHHSYDAALYVSPEGVLYRTPDGRGVDLLALDHGAEYYDRAERITVARDATGYRLTDTDGVTLRFEPPADSDTIDPAMIDLDAAAGPAAHEPAVTYRLCDVVNRSGHRISLRHDGDRLVEIVDSGGRVIGLDHDDAGRVVALTAPHPDVVGERFDVARYGYDDRGNLISMTDALGHVFTYEYAGHLIVRETDRTGLSFYFEFDGADEKARCLHTWGDGGIYDHRLTYGIGETTVVNSLGHATRYEHEGGLVIRSVDAVGAERHTRFEYQQPVEEVDPLGRVTALAYDHRGNLVETVASDGAVVRAIFDEHDQPVSAVDPVGGEWRWHYDDDGHLTRRVDPLGAASTFTYRAGQLDTVTDPAGGVTTLSYDEQGSLTSVRTPDGATSGWGRNQLGWSFAVLDPLGNEQRREFDLMGRVVRVQEPDGNVRDLEYDGESNVLHAVDRLYDVKFTYGGMGRMLTRTQADTTVRFEYDTEEQLTGIVNEHGHAYGFTLGPTGEVTVERGFDDVRRVYEHDRAGRVAAVRRASGIVTRYSYDGADRVTAVEHSDGTGEQYEYRADGALMTAANQTCRVAFERDLLGRVVREFQDDFWVASEYDALGQRTRMTSSMGADVAITRNVMGDVTGVTSGDFEARFERDALGQELARTLPGGVRARWHRDRLGRPVRHEVTAAEGVVRDRTYDWDVDDRLRGVADAIGGPIRYQHDALGQLVSAAYPDGRVDFRMPDAVGNLFRTADRSDRRYGPAGQLLSSLDENGRQVAFGYDAEGNLTSKTHSDGATWLYRWEAGGQLSAVVRPDLAVVSFSYDPLGRRLSKGLGHLSTRWIWDADVPLHEWQESEQAPKDGLSYTAESPRGVPVTWILEPGTFAPIAKIIGESTLSLVVDFVGAPVLGITEDGVSGWSGELRIWGERSPERGASVSPFKWPGQYADFETGLDYNRYRYYDAQTGHYLSQDPVRLSGGLRTFAYVVDPTIEVDPFGLTAEPVLPSRIVHAYKNIAIHQYYASPREHANPIHFHVIENGRRVGKIFANGTVLGVEGGAERTMNEVSSEVRSNPTLKGKLRKAQRQIAKYFRATGKAPGGQPFAIGASGYKGKK